MARFNVWLQTYVLSILKSPSRRNGKKPVKELTISGPTNVRHEDGVPYLPRSISAIDLPTQLPTSHARHNSLSTPGRPLTVHIREPSCTTPPPVSFPMDLPLRSNSNSTSSTSPTSPNSKRLSKRFSMLSTSAREVMASHSETPRPVSYFAPGYDVSIADLMPIADEVNETTTRDAKRLSHISVIERMQKDERRRSKRMSMGADAYRVRSRDYAPI